MTVTGTVCAEGVPALGACSPFEALHWRTEALVREAARENRAAECLSRIIDISIAQLSELLDRASR